MPVVRHPGYSTGLLQASRYIVKEQVRLGEGEQD
jgi:hypothetical protein